MLKNEILFRMMQDIVDLINLYKADYDIPDLKVKAYLKPNEIISPPLATLNFKSLSLNLASKTYNLNLDLVVALKGLKNIMLEAEIIDYIQKLIVLLMENRPKFSEHLISINSSPSLIDFGNKTAFKGAVIELSYNISYLSNNMILAI